MGDACPQASGSIEGSIPDWSSDEYSEDCLNLNIYMPVGINLYKGGSKEGVHGVRTPPLFGSGPPPPFFFNRTPSLCLRQTVHHIHYD